VLLVSLVFINGITPSKLKQDLKNIQMDTTRIFDDCLSLSAREATHYQRDLI